MEASSGTAAMTMVVNSTLSMGDNIVVSEDVYAGQCTLDKSTNSSPVIIHYCTVLLFCYRYQMLPSRNCIKFWNIMMPSHFTTNTLSMD